MALQRKPDPAARFFERLRDLAQNVARPPMVVPVLDANPPETDPTNLWLLGDGRLRSRVWNGTAYVYYEYTPVTPTGAAPPAVPSQGAVATTRQTVYSATWSQSYVGSGAKRTGDGETLLYYGDQGDGTGINKSLIGFDYTAIQTDLAGSTIKNVQLVFGNVKTLWGTGSEVFFGVHNTATEPTTWPAIPRSKVTSARLASTQTLTVPLTTEFGTMLRDGTGKGVAVESPSNDAAFAGAGAGVGSGYTTPQLIITYVK